MKEFVFRMAETKDAQAIYEIEMKTFAKPWSLAAIMDEIRSGENSASFKGDGAVRYKSEITRAITNFFERHSWKSKKTSSRENKRADEVEQKLQWCTDRISVSLEFRNEYQDAVGIAILGKRKFLEEEFVDFGELLPVYMRKPEAQRNLEERLKKDQ